LVERNERARLVEDLLEDLLDVSRVSPVSCG
jgi:hypothetical protein